MSTKKDQINLKRRDFLKGSLAVGAGGLAISLGACAPKVAETPANNPAPSAAATSAPAATCEGGKKVYSFDNPPAPVAESDIKATKTADVVVLGAGVSGFCAALSASEGGAKVIQIEKRNTFMYHGGWNGVIGDRLHEQQGVALNRELIVNEIMRFAAFHNDQRLVMMWANNSGRVMNKLLDLADANGIKYRVATDVKSWSSYQEFPTAVQFLPEMQKTLASMLEKEVLAKGVDLMYETQAIYLLKDDAGTKVTGVIAKGKDGYIKVNANKAVIICTGGYVNNQEMFEKYEPRGLKVKSSMYSEGTDMGEGINMGIWAGGVKQETTCPMLWDGLVENNPMFISIARQPWLYVNLNGERYGNEDAPYGYTANQDINQPNNEKWSIWDANWKDDVKKFGGTVCENMDGSLPFWTDKSYDHYKEAGNIIEANTIEELADLMKIPKEAFLASVKRYNELVEKGVDDDFCKDAKKLTAIKQAPFAACKVGTGTLVTLDGLQINPNMQVLDANKKPIPGLYAAGNASGNFFSNDYSIMITGVSHGRALTFGWVAGENAAKL